ncbi:16S rRNA (uracil1498-N3)-methyltransferase [Tistlia consotensis]|uniref:Ribosomal RNA small subunit methyltransferase E n=1 Tax=Tistlia consotensis USBA 355 TaxID=560819 RepID=A0A1Y6C6J9_9PROT|nr:16S rRNA (uracil(1498)-N(3))-methyltransferase [Tistlia consotensis]SMF39441.1 16S rRNA (uracil1498-N3)-methyltransferase [Tistlia consotensis USBA 355]SNR36386.1 16S rRNA (uracil1498-N3)-methyltransferase [Tistlia consotensis]
MTQDPTSERVATRLFVEEDLRAGLALGLDRERAHFLRSVLRLAPGAALALFNGRDGEWLGRLDAVGKGWASLVVEAPRRPQVREPDLWLAFAPIKRARIDFVAEKASELGCSLLQPVLTRFTAVERVNVQRLAANAREAAEQCERLSVPQVREPLALDRLLGDWEALNPPGATGVGRLLVMADEGGAHDRSLPPLAEAIRAAAPRAPEGRWALLIGPEGGFAEPERELLAGLPFVVRGTLGPRLLRADTAAIAGLALLQSEVGDWR